MRRIGWAVVLAASCAAPSRIPWKPSKPPVPLCEKIAGNRGMVFEGERVLAQQEFKDYFMIVTDKHIWRIYLGKSVVSRTENFEKISEGAKILENGRSVVIVTPTGITWYEFVSGEVVTHEQLLRTRGKFCRADEVLTGKPIPSSADAEVVRFTAEEDGRTVRVAVQRN
ncbi:MAG TPA: hypothetical protein VJH24_00650 [Candidatus Bilamarchaeaceae archaeon]|nr:hypothetical protein [Candidatus Bilamarchaeaceae archaeon]